jgi:Family of unknown function (DUF6159)/Membrane domain of glycerophosphoryl diester phosphodiesterase
VLLVLYCASDFVIIFFNTALMAAVAKQLDGEEATVADGLRAASRWIVEILAWSLIAGTVGLVIQIVEERLGRGRLIGRLVDAAWTTATFFIIPVIIFEGQSDLQALRRSAELFKKQWGTEVAGRLGLSAVFFLASVLVVTLAFFVALFARGYAVVIAGMMLLVLYLLHEALEGVFAVALYRYATTGAMIGGFTPAEMQGAFGSKTPGWTDVDLTAHGQTERRLGTWHDLQTRLTTGGAAGPEHPTGSEPS